MQKQNQSKRLTIVHGFRPKSGNFDFGKKRIPLESASQEEHFDANFSFVIPSSEEFRMLCIYICI